VEVVTMRDLVEKLLLDAGMPVWKFEILGATTVDGVRKVDVKVWLVPSVVGAPAGRCRVLVDVPEVGD
jgi:hypothetical protein